MEFGKIALELSIGFLALLVATRILGKTQITQITPFDFISALILGELVGNAVYDDQVGLSKVLFSIILWVVLILIVEWVTQKWMRTRHYLEGQPTIIIHKGRLIREGLKKSKIDINQIQHLLRAKDVFSLREVEFAVLETNGDLSVLKKSQYGTPTRNDLNIQGDVVTLPVTMILDGNAVKDNLQEFGFDENWLVDQLKPFGTDSIKDVLYAEWQEGSGLFVVKF